MLEKYGIKFETYFYHLSEIEVNKGDLVDKGELVALSGKTGKRQTGPHCHVEARVNDMPVDPKIIYGDPGDWND